MMRRSLAPRADGHPRQGGNDEGDVEPVTRLCRDFLRQHRQDGDQRDRQEQVSETGDGLVDPALEIARDRAHDRAERRGDQRDEEGDLARLLSAA